MFSHPQRDDPAHGVDAPDGLNDPPNVYHPHGDAGAAPAYEAYADPAAAHGWQNAYDDTMRMDPVVEPAGEGSAERAAGEAGYGGDGVGGGGRRRRKGRRQGRRKEGEGRRRPRSARHTGAAAGWIGRRGVLVAGGVGAVLVAVTATVAGMFGSGSSEHGDRRSPTVPESVPAAESPGTGGPSGETAAPSSGASSGAADDASTRSSDGTSASASPDGSGSDAPTPATRTPSAPAASATTAGSSRGNSGNNPGRGQGWTKGPK